MGKSVKELEASLAAGREAWAAERSRVRALEAELATLMDQVKTEWGMATARKLWASRSGSHPSPAAVRRRAVKVHVNTKGN